MVSSSNIQYLSTPIISPSINHLCRKNTMWEINTCHWHTCRIGRCHISHWGFFGLRWYCKRWVWSTKQSKKLLALFRCEGRILVMHWRSKRQEFWRDLMCHGGFVLELKPWWKTMQFIAFIHCVISLATMSANWLVLSFATRTSTCKICTMIIIWHFDS